MFITRDTKMTLIDQAFENIRAMEKSEKRIAALEKENEEIKKELQGIKDTMENPTVDCAAIAEALGCDWGQKEGR